MSKLTLVDVAKMAGVSRSTVSRVINNQPNVKADVRERVLRVVAETGYHPDPVARSLANSRTGMIGLVIPQSSQFIFTDPYYPCLIQGITQACNKRDTMLSLFLLHSEEEEAKLYPRITRQQLFDGLILVAVQTEDKIINMLLGNDVPFVCVGRHINPKVNFVDVDNVYGAHNAVTHLRRLGCERIATITGLMNNLAAVDRHEGYLNALRNRGLTIDPNLIVHGDYTEISGYEGMQKLLPHKPDGVFVASDTMAMGVIRALRAADIRVPDDIAIVGFDDLPQSAINEPSLTTVRQPVRQTGMQAVETLFDILDNGSEPSRRIMLPTELVIRASSFKLQ